MTEYDYSPEAYQRYLATQNRIAKWVDKTEVCRPQFANPLSPPETHMPGYEPPEVRSAGLPPHRPYHGHGQHRQHHHRSRSPSPDTSEESYGLHAPGPMPPMRSAPGHMGAFPQHQLPFAGPSGMVSPPLMSPQGQMPPSYYGTPSVQQVKAQRRQQQQQHFYRSQAPAPILVSPPVSPGVYPHPASPTGYVMMPQQMAPMPLMYVRPR